MWFDTSLDASRYVLSVSRPTPTFFGVAVVVLSALVGIRRGGALLARGGVCPVHIIVAGVICAALLVTTRILIVRLVLP